MKQYILFVLILAGCTSINAQEKDSSVTLQDVTVKAFEQSKKLMQVPASVALITKSLLNRFGNASLVPVLNTQPGVRMEERSPGSYRLNIRGSSLRSPFGVRNIKIYYDDIPFTDPGGNTYLNQLGFYSIQSAEVIKGPGSSLYGAGTGGVLLLKTTVADWHPGASVEYAGGNWGLQNINVNLRLGKEAFQNKLNYHHLSSDGYRKNTALDRRIFSWDLQAKLSDKSSITGHFLWGDLFYQTPGALTLTEYKNNPRAARPGAEANKAAIYQKYFLTGISFNQKFSDHWQNTTAVYGAATRLLNPTTRNYGRTNEPHFGGRSSFQFNKALSDQTKFTLVSGVEFQQGISSVRIYSNKNGNPDTLQTDDEINNRVFFAFTQASLELKNNWFITAGLSYNTQQLSITRLSTRPVTEQSRKYDNQLAPRVAVLKQLSKSLSLLGSVARGFSPPTTAEVLPSTGIITTNLNAETGINYEAGARGSLNKARIYFDITAFYFGLKNTIVQRKDAGGADYFVNAGSTRQKGLETSISWQPVANTNKNISSVKIWLSHTWNDFRYKDFKQVTADYSGNKLPSVPTHFAAAGIDVNSKQGVYVNLTYYYSDPIPLNDANTDYASSYNLFNARAGWKKQLYSKLLMELFVAADNIFNVKYSLGNDINAFGGRYYNTAPAFNLSAGIALHLNTR